MTETNNITFHGYLWSYHIRERSDLELWKSKL